jgi:hypothetical protein
MGEPDAGAPATRGEGLPAREKRPWHDRDNLDPCAVSAAVAAAIATQVIRGETG